MIRSYGTLLRDARLLQARWPLRAVPAICSKPPETEAAKTESKENASNEAPIKRARGRPRKDAGPNAIAGATNEVPKGWPRGTTIDASTASTPRRTRKPPRIPARLLAPASKNHTSLSTFLAYAARTNLNTATNVYKGTLYEYTVAAALAPYNFTLNRTGRSNDLGIDLVGHFKLPHPTTPHSKRGGHEVRVLIQCKALKPTPSMVRELEGAYVGAPAGWNNEGVLALLVASKGTSKGVRDALQRSRWPMGLVQVTAKGEVRQFLWNPVAARVGLEGLGVTVRYDSGPEDPQDEDGDGNLVKRDPGVTASIALTWLGKLWRPEESKS